VDQQALNVGKQFTAETEARSKNYIADDNHMMKDVSLVFQGSPERFLVAGIPPLSNRTSIDLAEI